MNWKDLPYWLKGGVISATLYAVFAFPLFITNKEIFGDTVSFLIIVPFIFVMGYLNVIFGPDSIFDLGSFWGGGNSTTLGIIIGHFITTTIFFSLGSLIGYIIGKIKNKDTK